MLLSSCHFLAPRDLGDLKKVKDVDGLKHMDGVWMATGITYDLMRNMGYPMDSVRMDLHGDSTFTIEHLPDCVEDQFGNTVYKQLFAGAGKWTVYQFGGTWTLRLDFERACSAGRGLSLDMNVYRDGGRLIVSQYIGDPDAVKVLELYRVE